VKVGSIPVDGGTVIVGDPAYVRGVLQAQETEDAGKSFEERIANLTLRERLNAVEGHPDVLGFDTGIGGSLAIQVPAGFGDGGYDVLIRRTPRTGRVAELRVVFVPEGEDRCPECRGVPSFEQMTAWGTDAGGYFRQCPTCAGSGTCASPEPGTAR
jgi:hypothetical protein